MKETQLDELIHSFDRSLLLTLDSCMDAEMSEKEMLAGTGHGCKKR